MGSHNTYLLPRTKVCWLSRVKVLTQLVELDSEVIIPLERKTEYITQLRDDEFFLKLTYFVDIFPKSTEINFSQF